jgi:GTP-binding protein HflX
LKALSGGDVFVEDRLFATLDTLTREVDVGEGYRFRVTDTVGFIRKLPHHLVASFRATLEEAQDADLLLHVIDAGAANWEEQAEVAETVLEELMVATKKKATTRNAERATRGKEPEERKRVVYVFNKADLLPDPEAFLAQVREHYPHAVLTSTAIASGASSPVSRLPSPGVDALRASLRTSAQALRPIAQIRVPVGDGKLRATLHRDAEVLGEVQTDGVVVVTARVEARLLGRLRQEGIEVLLGDA